MLWAAKEWHRSNHNPFGEPVGNYPKNPHPLAALERRKNLEENSEEKQN